jgi:hypothetical protein
MDMQQAVDLAYRYAVLQQLYKRDMPILYAKMRLPDDTLQGFIFDTRGCVVANRLAMLSVHQCGHTRVIMKPSVRWDKAMRELSSLEWRLVWASSLNGALNLFPDMHLHLCKSWRAHSVTNEEYWYW